MIESRDYNTISAIGYLILSSDSHHLVSFLNEHADVNRDMPVMKLISEFKGEVPQFRRDLSMEMQFILQ